jgi:glycyl-tRNA synthetase beta chain
MTNPPTAKNLLVELFVEELPPKALNKLGETFAVSLFAELNRLNLSHPAATDSGDLSAPYLPDMTAFASPRRLAVHMRGILSKANDIQESKRLMPVAVGLTASGEATPALLKRLVSEGADASTLPHLKRRMDGKAEALYLDRLVPGVSLQDGLQKALLHALSGLPIPKLMQYQLSDGWSSVNFVRPAHGLVALHGADVVAVQALGLTSGRVTRGHRFEASIPTINLRHADSYVEQLRDEGAVIASFAERHAEIAKQLLERAPAGLKANDDPDLLNEVTALVERPNVLLCQFEAEFLDVPQECLILTMKANQKYFPLLDAAGKLTNQFLIVSNITPADASRVIEGNERVVRPRLADAKFFFDQDRKKTLASRVSGLDKVVYHGKLGTQGERVARVRAIAKSIASTAFHSANIAEPCDQTAMLAKADLLTDMVGEFPELQGTMGSYYAAHDGLSTDVAQAIEDHYKPRFAGDTLPRSDVGLVVALADKLETLVGLFGIGQLPTGDKDPFALRRHALGVIRMLTERKVPIGLHRLIALAVAPFGAVITDPTTPLLAFMYERLAGGLRDQGYSAQEVDAVLSLKPDRLVDVIDRLAAVRAFAALPEAAALAAANKRVGNILKKVEGALPTQVDAALLKEPAEAALFKALNEAEPQANAAFTAGHFADSLKALAALRVPVDAFFESVMVNAEDTALRNNRLALLSRLHVAMNRVADLAKLAA